MKKALLCFFLSAGCVFVHPVDGRCDDPRDSVVKIFVTSNQMDFYRPWQSRGSFSATGSGCILNGQKILTNAHVVVDSTFIQVRKESDPTKYTAKVEAIGHDCDLAILTVEDPRFFEGIVPLEFGELPQLQDTVVVLGFPEGGDKLSITEGVVSRIEIVPYVQTSKRLLAVQIDAAINPGNSGGPVFKDGKIVGIAMQAMSRSQNIGYMIPVPIINHFLDDLQDNGTYDGFPSLGVEYHNTESSALREYYKLNDHNGGVYITRVLPFFSADGILQEGDIILAVNGVPLGMDGTFEFRNNERLGFSYLVHNQQIGQSFSFKIVRDGVVQEKTVTFQSYVELIPQPNSFEKPPYYIYGGMVFTVLSADLLQSWGQQWWEKAPLEFMAYLMGEGRLNLDRKKELVVLLQVLPDDVNIGYHDFSNEVIKKVNGLEFGSFEEFVKLLAKSKPPFTVIETQMQHHFILKNENLNLITKNIIERNNIPAPYSKEVEEWLKNTEK
ncbi:MAG: trypsin-like peptidase domain-containing protein [Candidatus Omnitrophota bacterium]|jgi:S1-C subfamily serine protease